MKRSHGGESILDAMKRKKKDEETIQAEYMSDDDETTSSSTTLESEDIGNDDEEDIERGFPAFWKKYFDDSIMEHESNVNRIEIQLENEETAEQLKDDSCGKGYGGETSRKPNKDSINLTGCWVIDEKGVLMVNGEGKQLLSGDDVPKQFSEQHTIRSTDELSGSLQTKVERKIDENFSCEKSLINKYMSSILSIIHSYHSNQENQKKFMASNQCNSDCFITALIEKCLIIIKKTQFVLDESRRNRIIMVALDIFSLKIRNTQEKLKRIRVPNKQLRWCIMAALLKLNECSLAVIDGLNFDTKFCQFVANLEDPQLISKLKDVNNATYLIHNLAGHVEMESKLVFKAVQTYDIIRGCKSLMQKTPRNLALGILSYTDPRVKANAAKISNDATIEGICGQISNYLASLTTYSKFFLQTQSYDEIETYDKYLLQRIGLHSVLGGIIDITCYMNTDQIIRELRIIRDEVFVKRKSIVKNPLLLDIFDPIDNCMVVNPLLVGCHHRGQAYVQQDKHGNCSRLKSRYIVI